MLTRYYTRRLLRWELTAGGRTHSLIGRCLFLRHYCPALGDPRATTFFSQRSCVALEAPQLGFYVKGIIAPAMTAPGVPPPPPSRGALAASFISTAAIMSWLLLRYCCWIRRPGLYLDEDRRGRRTLKDIVLVRTSVPSREYCTKYTHPLLSTGRGPDKGDLPTTRPSLQFLPEMKLQYSTAARSASSVFRRQVRLGASAHRLRLRTRPDRSVSHAHPSMTNLNLRSFS
jgi:hypothetical protein